MATQYQLPSSGQLSIDDIKDVMYSTSATSSNRSLNTLKNAAGLSTASISSFYSYLVRCNVVLSPAIFVSALGSSTSNNKYVAVQIDGVSETFTTTLVSGSWINWADDNANDRVNVWCDRNLGLQRSGTLKVTHDDNPDCYDTFTVTQEAGLITTTIQKVISTIQQQ